MLGSGELSLRFECDFLSVLCFVRFASEVGSEMCKSQLPDLNRVDAGRRCSITSVFTHSWDWVLNILKTGY